MQETRLIIHAEKSIIYLESQCFTVNKNTVIINSCENKVNNYNFHQLNHINIIFDFTHTEVVEFIAK